MKKSLLLFFFIYILLFKLNSQIDKYLFPDIGKTDNITCMAFSSNDSLMAIGSEDRKVRVFDIKKGKLIGIFAEHSGIIRCIDFNPKGNKIASIDSENQLKLWDLKKQTSIKTIDCKSNIQNKICFSPDNVLIYLNKRKRICFLNIDKDRIEFTLKPDIENLGNIKFSQNGKYFAYSSNYKLFIGNYRDKNISISISEKNPITELIFSPESKTLAYATGDNIIKILNIESKKIIELRGHSGDISCMSFDQSCKYLISGGKDSTVIRWSLDFEKNIAEKLRVYRYHKGEISGIHYYKNGRTIFTSSSDGTCRVWDLTRNRLTATLLCSSINDSDWAIYTPANSFDGNNCPMLLFYADSNGGIIQVNNSDPNHANSLIFTSLESVNDISSFNEYISLDNPLIDFSDENSYKISGEVKKGINKLKINDTIVIVKNGFFEYVVRLANGLNKVIIWDNLQLHKKEVIIYKGENPKNYALFFAVGDYSYTEQFLSLKQSIPSVDSLRSLLMSNYDFKSSQVIKNPSKKQILDTLKSYKDKIEPKDNLLIYFSGHGINGYFIPEGGDTSNLNNNLSYIELANSLRPMQSIHILLVLDACNSSSFGKSYTTKGFENESFIGPIKPELPDSYYKKILRDYYSKKTRLAITIEGVIEEDRLLNILKRCLKGDIGPGLQENFINDETYSQCLIEEIKLDDKISIKRFEGHSQDGKFLFIELK